jgi:hypothetical protein
MEFIMQLENFHKDAQQALQSAMIYNAKMHALYDKACEPLNVVKTVICQCPLLSDNLKATIRIEKSLGLDEVFLVINGKKIVIVEICCNKASFEPIKLTYKIFANKKQNWNEWIDIAIEGRAEKLQVALIAMLSNPYFFAEIQSLNSEL